MKNIGVLLVIITAFGLLLLKVYDVWLYLCIIFAAISLSYYSNRKNPVNKKDIFLKVGGLLVIVILYWLYNQY